jgi:ABC-type enterochelin transport system substrate-binding protein
MIDTDFEKDSRAHCFWEEWQSAADQEPDNTQRREGDEMSDYIASINPDWAFVVEK